MSKFLEYDNYDALGLAQLVRNGDISPEELLSEARARLNKIHTQLNIATYLPDDLSIPSVGTQSKDSIFCGVPFLVKDLMLPFKGMPLSNGTKAMRAFVSDENSAMANRLNECGLITFGKTTTSELGTLPLTKSMAFGNTLNPWNKKKNSGGSSGGSSVAVASRVVPMAYSSDGGGSIRLPASYCGIFGLKPSRGINPYEDMSEAWGGAVVSHVSTISVRDSAAYLDCITGNCLNHYQINKPVSGSYLHHTLCSSQQLTIGLITESPVGTHVHPECIKAAELAGQLCEKLGHRVLPAKWNFDGRELMRAFIAIVMHYTHQDVVNIAKLLEVDKDQLDIELNTRFMAVAGSGIKPEKLEQSFNIWKRACESLSALHQQFDVILTPTVATPPLESNALDPGIIEKLIMKGIIASGLGQRIVNDKSLDMAIDKSLYVTPFTPIANITGQPAMSVPLHWDHDGLPHGAHFMADIGNDGKLLMLAHQLEEICPWRGKLPVVNSCH
ncbi:amidase [Oceanospirillum sediminis]|uniref:Amidase n=1 Tax=Oceanospirillum sediminis TaxID=2760088 RepID=A0A839IUE6_9GAMM|nr:amidase family protein [Oceanospirillum sediminis]MBB1488561.1 amidase [Oceanospirillum sediminis]